jgi:NAD(P)-dependent dehydrogenase (short-subunit alcohol dehydrogenase family)
MTAGDSKVDLRGCTAVVTGGAGQVAGLGRGLVEQFAAAGMNVAVLDVDGAAAIRLVDELQGTGAKGLALEIDVRRPDSLLDAARRVTDEFGSCHILCAHVGGGGQGRFVDVPIEAWQEAMHLMVTGTVATVSAFLPLMQRSTGLRRIVVTSSVAALVPGRYQGPYRAAKAAVMSLGETLALELEDDGIATTIVFPSGMLPPELIPLALDPPPELRADPANLEMAIAEEMVRDPTDVAPGEDVARTVVDAIVAGDRYVITHGRTAERGYLERRRQIDRAFEELAGRSYRPVQR